MRAWEFITEARRVPKLSLRHINKLKHVKRDRQKAQDQRQELYAVMYSNPASQIQYLDLQKARIEIAQAQEELENTRAEVNNENRKAINKMASAGIKTRHKNDKIIRDKVMSGLGRRMKP